MYMDNGSKSADLCWGQEAHPKMGEKVRRSILDTGKMTIGADTAEDETLTRITNLEDGGKLTMDPVWTLDQSKWRQWTMVYPLGRRKPFAAIGRMVAQ